MLETLIRHLDMVKLTLGAVAMAAALSGCYGLLDDPGDGLTENQRKARTLFVQRAYDSLMTSCGASNCHGQAVVPFLAGDGVLNVYTTIREFKPELISKIDALKSRLLTKGPHSGPEFSTTAREGQIASDYETVLEWLRAEQRAADDSGNVGSGSGGVSYIVTNKITPVECTSTNRATCQINTLSLEGVRPDGTGITGAKVEFLYEVLQGANAPYIVNLRLVGGPEGAYIESPIFLGYEAGKAQPTVDGDTFFDVKVNAPATMTRTIGAGYAGLTDIKARGDGGAINEFAMSFTVVDKYRPDNTPVNPSACKQLAMYQAMMKPTLTARCNGCHVSTSGNAGARGSMTLYTADDATSCQQVKTLGGNLNNITASSIYNAPRMGALASHADFKFTVAADQTAWENAVTTWLTAERNSP